MSEHTVRVTETLSRLVTVEAENEVDADETVRNQYRDEEVVLDASDFDSVKFEVE